MGIAIDIGIEIGVSLPASLPACASRLPHKLSKNYASFDLTQSVPISLFLSLSNLVKAFDVVTLHTIWSCPFQRQLD